MRRPSPAVGRKRGWHLSNFHAEKIGFYYHLCGKFHAGRTQVHFFVCLFAESAQPTVKVPAGSAKKQPANTRQYRIPQILVQWWHGTGKNSSTEAIPHYQIIAGTQFLQKTRDVPEIITIVSIPHDDVLAAGSRNSAHESTAISSLFHR